MIRSLQPTTDTAATPTEDSVRFWIVQFLTDAFRREGKNVGVIVQRSDQFEARFLGEKESHGDFDDRRLRFTPHASVYRQWVRYYRRKLVDPKIDSIEALRGAATTNFQLIDGGRVNRTDTDDLNAVCRYTFSMLVSESGLADALEAAEPVVEKTKIRQELRDQFRTLGILGANPIGGRHPILTDQSIVGQRAAHEFSFVQRHKSLDLIEPLNLKLPRDRRLKEKAGWLAYAMSDVLGRNDQSTPVRPFVVIDPTHDITETSRYCLDLFEGVSEIIDWRSDTARKAFLDQRVAAAT